MRVYVVNNKIKEFVQAHADRLTLNGKSVLGSADLKKANRNDYQHTGLYGEAAWHIFRYGSLDKLYALHDVKHNHYLKTGEGDNGCDDFAINFRGVERLIDVKTSHAGSIDRVKFLYLPVAPQELHDNMVYVAAFTSGPSRTDVTEVILAGWCLNEDMKERWPSYPEKFAVSTKKLTPMDSIVKFF